MTETWKRPYAPGAGRWLVIGWEAAALAMLGWTTIRKFDMTLHGIRTVGIVLAVTWLIGAWRIARMGVYVGEPGLRIRGLLRSRTVRWHNIAHVRLHKSTHRLARWQIESGLTILIERVDGSWINTELWAQGVDFHSRPREFRAVYNELRTRHLAAVSGA